MVRGPVGVAGNNAGSMVCDRWLGMACKRAHCRAVVRACTGVQLGLQRGWEVQNKAGDGTTERRGLGAAGGAAQSGRQRCPCWREALWGS